MSMYFNWAEKVVGANITSADSKEWTLMENDLRVHCHYRSSAGFNSWSFSFFFFQEYLPFTRNYSRIVGNDLFLNKEKIKFTRFLTLYVIQMKTCVLINGAELDPMDTTVFLGYTGLKATCGARI